jgi:hypothetical protein
LEKHGIYEEKVTILVDEDVSLSPFVDEKDRSTALGFSFALPRRYIKLVRKEDTVVTTRVCCFRGAASSLKDVPIRVNPESPHGQLPRPQLKSFEDRTRRIVCLEPKRPGRCSTKSMAETLLRNGCIRLEMRVGFSTLRLGS